jgi:glycolate oxidase iron-sulfur subunit
MQTTFTPAQLADPEVQSADAILRRCVHCGFCNATCPTYQLTGDELDGPRGRIYLIKGMLERSDAGSGAVAHHLDRCLSCLACMTTCPSGVDYMHLIDIGRRRIATHPSRGFIGNLHRALLARVLPDVSRLRLLLPAARTVLRLLPLAARLRPARDLLEHASPAVATWTPHRSPATSTRRGAVALLAGCVQQWLGSAINEATVRLLNRAGFDVDVLQDGCCGAIAHHLGDHARALLQIRRNVAAWTPHVAGWQAILVNASGCGTMLKDYAHLLRADDATAAGAAGLATLFRDVCEFLAGIEPEPAPGNASRNLRVVSHTPCSLRHGQRVIDAPRVLLRRAGFTVAEAPVDDTCCGSAGTYNLLQPDIADTLGRNKADALAAAGGDVVATGNLGCIMHIARFAHLPILHTVQLLDWAGGGPRPRVLASLHQPKHASG